MNSDSDSVNHNLMTKVDNTNNTGTGYLNFFLDSGKDENVDMNNGNNNRIEKSASTNSRNLKSPNQNYLQEDYAIEKSQGSKATPRTRNDQSIASYSVDAQAEKTKGNAEKTTIGVANSSKSDKQNGKRRRSRSSQGNQYNKKISTKMEMTINSDLIRKVTEEAVLDIQENPSFLTKSDHYIHFYEFINYAKANADLFPVLTTKEGTHTAISVSKAKKGKCSCPKEIGKKKLCSKVTIYKCLECSFENSEQQFFCANPNNFDDENSCFYKHKKLVGRKLKKEKV